LSPARGTGGGGGANAACLRRGGVLACFISDGPLFIFVLGQDWYQIVRNGFIELSGTEYLILCAEANSDAHLETLAKFN
jgi:hypothetical protein